MNLNEAIYKVIKTQFKKDMGEALRLVEEAGYRVSKWDSRFYVKNERTNREVCLRESYFGNCIISGNGYEKCKFHPDEVCRFDFIGYLEKPHNLAWYDIEAKKNDWRSPTWYKYDRLRSIRNSIKYAEDSINTRRKQIADLQRSLENDIEYRVKREQQLVEVRKELRLIK